MIPPSTQPFFLHANVAKDCHDAGIRVRSPQRQMNRTCPRFFASALFLAAAVEAAILPVASAETNAPPVTIQAGLVENGDFEATNDLSGWSLAAEGGGQGDVARDSATPSGESNSHSLRLTVKRVGSRCGVVNNGSEGMKFEAGVWYDFNFHARTETNKHFGLVVSLESADGRKVCARATIPEVGGEWKQYTLALHARQSDPKGRLVVAMFETGTIWLDAVSLTPRKTSD